MNEPEVIAAMLAARDGTLPTIAVVGLSADEAKPSHYVSAYMQARGYRIVPVNPALAAVLGEKAYASLRELPLRPNIVNVFRLPQYTPEIVAEMIELGLPALWVQQGLMHAEAAKQAEAAGILVVMDRCIMVEHRLLGSRAGSTR